MKTIFLRKVNQNLLTALAALTFSLISFGISAQWYPQASGTNENLLSICFPDSLNGWAVGYNGTILHTDDGGDNWGTQSCDTNALLRDVYFTDTTHGWIAGFIHQGYFDYGFIYRTNDGGVNWENLGNDTLPILTPVLDDVQFLDTLNGWAAGGSIRCTSDGGENWESQFSPSSIGRSICFTDSLNGWVAGGHMNGSTGYTYRIIYNRKIEKYHFIKTKCTHFIAQN